MRNFIRKFCLFITSFISLLILIFWLNNGSLEIDLEQFNEEYFDKKKDYFSNFIDNNQSINLLLGSSLMEDSIIPDSLGTKWFSFTNGAQNIYESYKFIDYYKDSVKIDTIIIAIQPFDFPYSYVKNRMENKPDLNGHFYVFGSDSITTINKDIKNNIQVLIERNFLDINRLFKKITTLSGEIPKHNEKGVWSKQGFSGYITPLPINLDTLFLMEPHQNNRERNWFYNVKKPPNLFYLDLFDLLTNSLGIKVIYLITPKSKYYHKWINEMNYDKIWEEILDSLKTRPVVLWDYEKMITDYYYFIDYRNGTHFSNNGAKVFTEIIRKRLYKTSN